ncbi:tetratricopeptide repeat protein [Joostella sp. CR20]|uniref:tetratricopeptide repeat protein n=1 Tax=Joostella sp. CR20 TaxID=2804312 RepID=UPI00313CA595
MKIFFTSILLLAMMKVGAQAPTFSDATTAYENGNYVDAINLYAQNPTPKANLQIARAYQALGNYDKAEKQYLETIQQDPTLYVAQNELGKLYFKISEFEKSKKVYYKLITNFDNKPNPFYYYQLGLLENIAKKPYQAIGLFKMSYKIDSTNIKNIYQIGKHHLQQKQYDSVHKYAEIGLKMAPNSIDLNNLKALAYFNYGEKKEAIPYFEKLIELHQEKTYIYKSLAQCYEFMYENEKAFECYKRIVEIDNGDPEGYRGLGKIYFKEKQYDSAKINYNIAIEIQKIDLTPEYHALANIALEEKDVKTAIGYFKKAYEQNPENYFALYKICFYSDEYYKDPKYKLNLYEDFVTKFPDKSVFTEHAKKRISALKQEIHLLASE